jgi:hypothetical protein
VKPLLVLGRRPLDAKRNESLHRRTIEKGVDEVVIVLHLEVPDIHHGFAGTGTDGDIVRIDLGRPEQPILFDAGIEIVNLIGPDLGLKDVQSYQGERAVTMTAFCGHERAFHEPQIHFEWHRRACAGPQIGSHTGAIHDGVTQVTVEVRNG